MFGLEVGLAVIGIGAIAWAAERAKSKALLRAPAGSTRVESTKASNVSHTVDQYTRAGWNVESQTSAKSFGSQARVTITFRKGGTGFRKAHRA